MAWNDRRACKRNTLPAYDPAARCPKCGHDSVTTNHRAAGCSDPDCWTCDQEHLFRICQRCHYGWPEAVVTAPVEVAP